MAYLLELRRGPGISNVLLGEELTAHTCFSPKILFINHSPNTRFYTSLEESEALASF